MGAAIWELRARPAGGPAAVRFICAPQHACSSFTWLSHCDRDESQSYRPQQDLHYAAPHDQFACRTATQQNLFLSFIYVWTGRPLYFVCATPRLFVCLFAIPAEVFQINVGELLHAWRNFCSRAQHFQPLSVSNFICYKKYCSRDTSQVNTRVPTLPNGITFLLDSSGFFWGCTFWVSIGGSEMDFLCIF